MMLQDLANYDKLYEEECVKYVTSGKGTVSSFCRIHDLQSCHEKTYNENKKIIKYMKDNRCTTR